MVNITGRGGYPTTLPALVTAATRLPIYRWTLARCQPYAPHVICVVVLPPVMFSIHGDVPLYELLAVRLAFGVTPIRGATTTTYPAFRFLAADCQNAVAVLARVLRGVPAGRRNGCGALPAVLPVRLPSSPMPFRPYRLTGPPTTPRLRQNYTVYLLRTQRPVLLQRLVGDASTLPPTPTTRANPS